MTETQTITTESGVALSDFNSSPMTIHGVAIGEDEVTEHLEGDKFWGADELEAATDSLVGAQLTKNHQHNDVDSVIGEVTKATYKDGVGILFEANIHEESTAHKIEKGLLEVSVHARHGREGVDDDGNIVVTDIEFQDLSVVPRGAAESNEVHQGPLEVAALSDELDAEFGTEYAELSFATENDIVIYPQYSDGETVSIDRASYHEAEEFGVGVHARVGSGATEPIGTAIFEAGNHFNVDVPLDEPMQEGNTTVEVHLHEVEDGAVGEKIPRPEEQEADFYESHAPVYVVDAEDAVSLSEHDEDKDKYKGQEMDVEQVLTVIEPILAEKVDDVNEAVRDALEESDDVPEEMVEPVMGAVGGIASTEMDDALSLIESALLPDESDDSPEDESPEEDEEESVSEQQGEDESEYSDMTENELEERIEELEAEVEALESENDSLTEEVMSVRREYATALAEHSPFDAEELAEKFTVDELAQKYEDTDEAELAEGGPAPRGEDVEETELDESPEDEGASDEEIEMLRQKKERFESLEMEGALAAVEERLEELDAE